MLILCSDVEILDKELSYVSSNHRHTIKSITLKNYFLSLSCKIERVNQLNMTTQKREISKES